MPICKDREYRTLAQPLQVTEDNKRFDSAFYAEGFATTFNKPYVLYEIDGIQFFEQIDRHALDDADMDDVIMQYDHEGKVLARLSNNTLGLEALETGLFIFADLSKSTAAKDLHEEILNGLVTKMSWGFRVHEDEYDPETRLRTILKVRKVYDVSAVSIPANADTDITARSFAQGRFEAEQKQELLRRVAILQLKTKLEG